MVSATDYFPFGSELPGRTYAASEYEFGFNGKTEDTEILPDGRWQDYGFRAYRPDIGRFVSVDPLSSKNCGFSTYSGLGNNPLVFVDPDGMDNIVYLYALPGTYRKMIKQTAKLVEKELSSFGLCTKVVVVKNAEKALVLDPTDALIAIGSRESIKSVVTRQWGHTLNKRNGPLTTNSLESWAKGPHRGTREDKNNAPETSGDRISVIDFDAIPHWTKQFKSATDDETLATIVLHSIGYMAGLSHNSDSAPKDDTDNLVLDQGFMTDGNTLPATFQGAKSKLSNLVEKTIKDQPGIKDIFKRRFQPNRQLPSHNPVNEQNIEN